MAIYPGTGRKTGTWIVDHYDAAATHHRFFRAPKKKRGILKTAPRGKVASVAWRVADGRALRFDGDEYG